MSNHNNMTELEYAEYWASENGLPDREDAVSELFDEHVLPYVAVDDEPALNEAFCNYLDYMEKDGQISKVQAFNYCYSGVKA